MRKFISPKRIVYIFLAFIFISCGNKNDDIYKTKSGEYASVIGGFVADFPAEPKYMVIENQLGLDEFQIHLYRTALGPNKIFSLEYYDYPEHLINSLTDEQIFDQGVLNFSSKISDLFLLDFQESIEQNYLKGKFFVLKLKKEALKSGNKGHIQGKFFRKGNRFYTITYLGIDDNHTDSFMNSFRLIK